LFIALFGYQLGMDNTHIKESEQKLSDLAFLEEARLKFIQMHEYNITEYNCLNYSKDFGLLMSGFGYNITLDAGYNENNSKGHAWNKITIELDPQDGAMNNSKIFYNKYSEKDLKRYGVLK
jgi:hypothetical protein